MSIITKIKSIFGKKQQLDESINTFGTPINYSQYMSYRGQSVGTSVFGRDLFPYKPGITVRQVQEVWRTVSLGRYIYESNGQGHGVLTALRGLVIGKGFSVKAVSKEDNTNKRLVKRVQELIDEFREYNDMPAWEKECYIRSHRDGNSILRLYPDYEGTTQIRAIEVDQLRPPLDQDWEGEWSFGIKTKLNDWQTPELYCIYYWQDKPEIVEAHYIHHLKLNVMRVQKMGISSYWGVWDELDGVSRLRFAQREGEKVRQAIAFVQEFAQADKATVQSLKTNQTTQTIQRYSGDGTTRDVALEETEPGKKLMLPKTTILKDPPKQGSENTEAAIRLALSSVAVRFNVPLYVLTGEGDQSYASAIATDSGFRARIEGDQDTHCNYHKKIYKSVIEIEIEKGNLPEETLDLIDVHVIAPNPMSRNSKEQIEADLLLVKAGVMSDETFAQHNDLDLEEEQAKGAEKEEFNVEQDTQPETMSGELQKDEGKVEVKENKIKKKKGI